MDDYDEGKSYNILWSSSHTLLCVRPDVDECKADVEISCLFYSDVLYWCLSSSHESHAYMDASDYLGFVFLIGKPPCTFRETYRGALFFLKKLFMARIALVYWLFFCFKRSICIALFDSQSEQHKLQTTKTWNHCVVFYYMKLIIVLNNQMNRKVRTYGIL